MAYDAAKYLAEVKEKLAAIPAGRIVAVYGFDVKHHRDGSYSNGMGKKRIPLTLHDCAESICRVASWAHNVVPYIK